MHPYFGQWIRKKCPALGKLFVALSTKYVIIVMKIFRMGERTWKQESLTAHTYIWEATQPHLSAWSSTATTAQTFRSWWTPIRPYLQRTPRALSAFFRAFAAMRKTQALRSTRRTAPGVGRRRPWRNYRSFKIDSVTGYLSRCRSPWIHKPNSLAWGSRWRALFCSTWSSTYSSKIQRAYGHYRNYGYGWAFGRR